MPMQQLQCVPSLHGDNDSVVDVCQMSRIAHADTQLQSTLCMLVTVVQTWNRAVLGSSLVLSLVPDSSGSQLVVVAS